MQGAGHFHKTTEDAADKPQKVIFLGKVRKRDERRVRRHAQIWTPIPGIARVQGEQPIGIGAVRRLPSALHWYMMREDRENKQRKRAAVSRQLAGHDSSFFVCFFRYNTFFKKGSKMEKIKHNRFSKVLVLLMAVMMVLTMMPNGMGGYHTSLG